LHREVDARHKTEFRGTDPMRTVFVQEPDEGRSWLSIWMVVALACMAVAVAYLVT
jgi:hypothetical protein